MAALLVGQTVLLGEDTTLGEAMEEFAIHRLLALPVVDAGGRLAGLVDVQLYAEEAINLAEANRLADIYQLDRPDRAAASARAGGGFVPRRMPWLLANIAGGLACAAIAAVFHQVLADVLMLAMFIPLVLTLSEAVSMQSMTLTLQYLHGHGTAMRRLRMRLFSEWRTALLLGGVLGGAGGVCGRVLARRGEGGRRDPGEHFRFDAGGGDAGDGDPLLAAPAEARPPRGRRTDGPDALRRDRHGVLPGPGDDLARVRITNFQRSTFNIERAQHDRWKLNPHGHAVESWMLNVRVSYRQ